MTKKAFYTILTSKFLSGIALYTLLITEEKDAVDQGQPQ